MNDAPFQVTENYQQEDLSDVKEEKYVVPASKGVLFRINKVAVRTVCEKPKESESEENPALLRMLAMELRIVDGIESVGENGETALKYKNKPMFQDVVFWANPEKKTSDYYQKKQHLVQNKYLMLALGYDLKSPPAINDEFLDAIKDREVRGDITQENIRVFDPEKGDYVKTDDLKNVVKNFKAA